jgi:phosphatidate cytidylyltransferase
LILGVAIIAALVGFCWVDLYVSPPGVVLFVLSLIAALLAASEMIRLLSVREPAPLAGVVYLGTLAVLGLAGVPLFWTAPPSCPIGGLGWPALGVAIGILLAFLGEMRRYEQPGRVVEGLAKAVLAIVYVGLLLAFAVQLRIVAGPQVGLLAVVSMIAVVKMSDIGAYTVGRLVGKHKLAPVLSPGKTWEGAVGGVIAACLASYVVFELVGPRLDIGHAVDAPAWGWAAYGVAVAVAGMLGDLAESLLKRDAGRKDSSDWLPGFGGVLDLLDSILAASPVAYVFWVSGIVGV